MKRFINRSLLSLLLCISIPGLASQPMIKDCIGHYAYDIPQSADIAIVRASALRERGLIGFRPKFNSGVESSDAKLDYNGQIFIFEALNEEERTFYFESRVKSINDFKLRLYESRRAEDKEKADALEIKAMSDGFISYFLGGFAVLKFDPHYSVYFNYRESVAKDQVEAVANKTYRSFRSRSIGDIPTEKGICLPLAFLQDEDERTLELNAVYQLVDHPEVTIRISEETREDYYGKKSNKEELEERWFYAYRGITNQVNLLGSSKFRPVQIGGLPGLETLGEFVRIGDDKKKDYAYLAFARGKSLKDSSIYVHIHRNSKRLRGRINDEVMSKADFEAMAKQITRSIYRRDRPSAQE
ncbi:T6SS immunity protein Tli4 family protein [Pragia fontium]|uniref:T6SS immunity protein Tli4 family protein n=1 Tax=Pragia fontium TaxID=82985 RepID=UPI00064AC3EF|nr:T6SS immunity protein Tli4 family protein [Pragia fontium]AKJ41908.1 hypothetical protein QQ39_07280 [Pragia fontium]VEJ54805.1 Uncharacterised protein [Pragia fontium]